MREYCIPEDQNQAHTFLSTLYMASAYDDVSLKREVESLETASMRQDVIHYVNGNLTKTNNQSLKNVKPTNADQSSFTGTYREGNLSRHKRQRHGSESEGQYRCQGSGCNKRFKRLGVRLKHYGKDHPRLVGICPLIRRPSASRKALQTEIK